MIGWLLNFGEIERAEIESFEIDNYGNWRCLRKRHRLVRVRAREAQKYVFCLRNDQKHIACLWIPKIDTKTKMKIINSPFSSKIRYRIIKV